jgi:hypothetical protein
VVPTEGTIAGVAVKLSILSVPATVTVTESVEKDPLLAKHFIE